MGPFDQVVRQSANAGFISESKPMTTTPSASVVASIVSVWRTAKRGPPRRITPVHVTGVKQAALKAE
jgi:hypothetical protein